MRVNATSMVITAAPEGTLIYGPAITELPLTDKLELLEASIASVFERKTGGKNLSGHNDELTRRHWRQEMANCIYQMTDGELVIFMDEHPAYAERLRAALNEPDEIRAEDAEIERAVERATTNTRRPIFPNPAKKNPRGRPAKGSRLYNMSKRVS